MSTGDQISKQSQGQRKSRPWIAITAIIIFPVIGLTLVSRLAQNGPRTTFSTCLQDAMFLREGAPVFLSGNQIGYVAATTKDQNCPARATAVITDSEAKIPVDSTTSLTLSKVTGETEMVINMGRTPETTAKLKNGGVLHSTH
ncbi:MAG TPA: MlaD family protein [Terriglobales bacterium]|nr:MlaD family protein [Terriglobales bacterium]